MIQEIRDLQRALQATGLYAGAVDAVPGPLTARGFVLARDAGLSLDPRFALALADYYRQRRPRNIAEIQRTHGPSPAILEDDPSRRGLMRFVDNGAWRKRNIYYHEIPGLGPLLLHRRAAPAFIVAFAEAFRAYPDYRPGKVGAWCLRHTWWDPARPLSTHCGWAVDLDLDFDGQWETREDLTRVPRGFIEVLESWGLVWGGRWHGRDDMHFQYCG